MIIQACFLARQKTASFKDFTIFSIISHNQIYYLGVLFEKSFGGYNVRIIILMTIMKYSLFDLNISKNQFHPPKRSEKKKNWKKDLISLYIIRKDDGICLYSHHFNLGYISHIENQLVGMGFVAIIAMIKEVVNSDSQLKSINLSKKSILVESKADILSILVVKKVSPKIKEMLKKFSITFNHLFELQQQINRQSNLVCKEDYALTNDLINIIFSIPSNKALDLIPLIFKMIRRNSRENIQINRYLLGTKSLDLPNESIKKQN